MAYSSMKEKRNQERRNKPHGNYSTEGAKKSREVGKTDPEKCRGIRGTYRSPRVLGRDR